MNIRTEMIEYAALVSANEPDWSPEEIAEDAVEEMRHRSTKDGLKAGDRIMITELMKNEPRPIPIGATGTVHRITLGPNGKIFAVNVLWDSHRMLNLIFPDDAGIFIVDSSSVMQQAMEHYDEIVTLSQRHG